MESQIPEMKEIEGFEGYFVDSKGQVYSTRKNGGHYREPTPMTQKTDKDGYKEVGLYCDGKRYWRRVHRLVATAYLDNPNNLPQINHKDGNPANNNIDNLEWCSTSDNLKHSFRVLQRTPSITTARKVQLTNKRTNQIIIFDTEKECAKYLNYSPEHINKLLTGKRDIATWRLYGRYDLKYCDTEDVTTIP